MRQQITFLIGEDGMVGSRIGSEVAIPVLQYDKIGEGGDFTAPLEYELEKMDVFGISRYYGDAEWTSKVPNKVKNIHRKFWGLDVLDEPIDAIELEEDGGEITLAEGETLSFAIEDGVLTIDGEASYDVRRELSYILHLSGRTGLKVPKEERGGNFIT